MGAAGRAEGR